MPHAATVTAKHLYYCGVAANSTPTANLVLMTTVPEPLRFTYTQTVLERDKVLVDYNNNRM